MIFNRPELICSVSKRHRNMSLASGDTRDTLVNRKNFLSDLGIDYQHLVCAKQIHASNVRVVGEDKRGSGALSDDSALADTDALITDQRNLPLAILTADCLSIFLYDPATASIALIHAGWRSSREKIVLKTIELMQARFNTHPPDLYVGFGPALRRCCYLVEEEFKEYFPGELIEREKSFYLDLASINKKQLLDLGVEREKITDLGICTSCQNQDFFSYRKEGDTCGRAMSVIMLR